MYIKSFRKWLRRNPAKAMLIAFVAFLLKELPPYVSDVWALASDRPLVAVLKEQLAGWHISQFSVSWITTPLGLGALFAIIVLLLTGRREPVSAEVKPATAPCPYEWLHGIAERDKRELSKYVVVKDPSLYYEGLSAQPPYFVITFQVINFSVYGISIDRRDVDGAIYRNDDEISGNLKIVSHIENLLRGDVPMELALKQWVSPEEVTLITNPVLDTVLKFDRLKIFVKGGDDSQEIKSQRLRLPSSIPIKGTQPSNQRVNELKGRIEELESEKAVLEERVTGLESRWKSHVFSYSWLFAKVNAQEQSIDNYVEVKDAYFCYHQLQIPMLKFVFGIDFINRSVFDVTIEDAVNGYVEFEGTKLEAPPLIIHNPGIVGLSSEGTITLEQRLTRPEADLIASKDIQVSEISLKKLVITINGERIGRQFQMKLPARISVKSKPA